MSSNNDKKPDDRLREIFTQVVLARFRSENFPKFLRDLKQDIQTSGGMGVDSEKLEMEAEALFTIIIEDEANIEIKAWIERAKKPFLNHFFSEMCVLVTTQSAFDAMGRSIPDKTYENSANQIVSDVINDKGRKTWKPNFV